MTRYAIRTARGYAAGIFEKQTTICSACEQEWATDTGVQQCPTCANDGEIEGHVVRSDFRVSYCGADSTFALTWPTMTEAELEKIERGIAGSVGAVER